MLPHDAVSGVWWAGVLLSQRTAAGGGGAACTQLPGGPRTSSRKPDEVRTLDKPGDRDTGHRGWQGAVVHLFTPPVIISALLCLK